MPRGVYLHTRVPVLDRVLARVEVGVCWQWLGSVDRRGYGQVAMGVGLSPKRVHIVVWEQLVGPVPAGLELDHLCRNTGCCNPDHLEPVTHLENVRRGHTGRKRQLNA